MKVVILAGGFGTRLSEYTKSIPKPIGNSSDYYPTGSYGTNTFTVTGDTTQVYKANMDKTITGYLQIIRNFKNMVFHILKI